MIAFISAALNSPNPTSNLYGVSGLPHLFILKPSFELCSFIYFKMELLWFTSERNLWSYSYCCIMAKSCNMLNPYVLKNSQQLQITSCIDPQDQVDVIAVPEPQNTSFKVRESSKNPRSHFSRTRSSSGVKWHQRNDANLH